MLLALVVTVPLTTVILAAREWISPHIVETEVAHENMNLSVCTYVKQFNLLHQTYATVCNSNGHIIVDVRLFLNHTATSKGIGLNLRQWLTLKQLTPTIDRSIHEARNILE